jgi:broad specificity phosphatase PhoE
MDVRMLTIQSISCLHVLSPKDRFDYANDDWAPAAKKFGALTTDPPLSALGHRQAKETANYLLKTIGKPEVNGNGSIPTNIAKIMVSPYLRVIQTACPISDELGIPLSIEYGLSEAHATPGNVLPSPEERFAYFPHVDPTYHSLHQIDPTPGFTCPKTGHPSEAFAGHYTKRMGEFAKKIEEHHRGETIVCFSHAASVALVAALLKCSMRELKFAACGVYELERNNDGPWRMVKNGDSNPHVSETSLTTYPWGFSEKHFKEVDGGRYYGESEGIGLDYFVPSSSSSS